MLKTLLSSARPPSKPLAERNWIGSMPAVVRKLAKSPFPSSASRSCEADRNTGIPENMPCARLIIDRNDAGSAPVVSLHRGVAGTAQAHTWDSSVRGLVVLMLILPWDQMLTG